MSPRAPTCTIFNYDASATNPQPHAEHVFFVFYGHVIAGNDTIAQKGAKRSPFLTTRWEGMPPQFY